MKSSPYFSATALAASWPCWFQPKSVGSSGVSTAMLFTSAAWAMPPKDSASSETCAKVQSVFVLIARFLPVFVPTCSRPLVERVLTPRMLGNPSPSTLQCLPHRDQALGPEAAQLGDLLRRVAEDAAAGLHAQLARLGALGHVGAEVAPVAQILVQIRADRLIDVEAGHVEQRHRADHRQLVA